MGDLQRKLCDLASVRDILQSDKKQASALKVPIATIFVIHIAYVELTVKEVRNILNEHEVRIDCRNRVYATPLLLAAQAGCFGMVQLLIAKGANPIAKDSIGRTGLHYVLEGILQYGVSADRQKLFEQFSQMTIETKENIKNLASEADIQGPSFAVPIAMIDNDVGSIVNKKIDENGDQLDMKAIEDGAGGDKSEGESAHDNEGSGMFPFLTRLLELKADPMRVNIMGDDAILLAQIRGSRATKELFKAWIETSGGIQNLKEMLKK
eukprot:jgi/Bigna1/90202/estExt_fgenesh1_pg.C_650024